MRRPLSLVIPSALIAVVSACSLLTDLGDLGGDAATGNDGGLGAPDAHEDLEVLQGDGGVCECVELPAVGFRGPVATWTGQGTAPACDPNYSSDSYDGMFGPNAAAAICNCSCGPANGTTCPTSFSANLYGSNTCTGNKCDTVTVNSFCTNVQANCDNVNGIEAVMAPTGGSCAPDASSTVPPVTWQATVRECETAIAPPQGACPSGQVCTPIPAAPYEPRPCIIAMGANVPCPQFYSYQRVFYTGSMDTRSCSACSCNTPTGACTGTLEIECGGGGTKTITSNTCTSLSDPISIALQGQPTFAGGCAPDGGEPTGSFDAGQATTVCCVP